MEEKENKRVHKNIRGAEYYLQVAEEMKARKSKAITPIMRLREFVQWGQRNGLCRSENDFERKCSLSSKYIANNFYSGKGNIGTEMLGRITRVFPQLNLAWICTGEGPMLNEGGNNLNADYKKAYEAALMQIEALNRILRSQNK